MKKIDITPLLSMMGITLVSCYEQTCLKGSESLIHIQHEYDSVTKDPDAVLMFWTRVLVYSFFSSIIAIALLFVFAGSYQILGILPFAIAAVLFLKLGKNRILKSQEVLSRCGKLLEDFIVAERGINPLDTAIQYRSKEPVRKVLVRLAVRILEAEGKFDVVRKLDHRDTFGIIDVANCLVLNEDLFAKTLICAKEKFGIEFARQDLFADARKHIYGFEEHVCIKASKAE